MAAKGLDAVGSMEDQRESAEDAEYMELAGALKDADCEKVEVDGGVSSKLGCCDYFQPKSKKVQQFRCGECRFME